MTCIGCRVLIDCSCSRPPQLRSDGSDGESSGFRQAYWPVHTVTHHLNQRPVSSPQASAHMIFPLSLNSSTATIKPRAIDVEQEHKSVFREQVCLCSQGVFSFNRIDRKPLLHRILAYPWVLADFRSTRHVFGHVLHMTSTLDPAIESKETQSFQCQRQHLHQANELDRVATQKIPVVAD